MREYCSDPGGFVAEGRFVAVLIYATNTQAYFTRMLQGKTCAKHIPSVTATSACLDEITYDMSALYYAYYFREDTKRSLLYSSYLL